MRSYHIIGAGMAGLASAIRLISKYGVSGQSINLYEAAPQAGGRCRSFHDAELDCEIDNGNHLLLSGNYCAANYLDIIEASHELIGPDQAVFPFYDLKTRERWNVEFNPSSIPFWLFKKKSRVRGARLIDHLSLLKLMRANETKTIADLVDHTNPLYERLIDPLSVAVINMTPQTASAKLMRNVLRETALKGGRACQPRIVRNSLAKTLVNPAIDYLKANGVSIHMRQRLKSLKFENHHVKHLSFTQTTIPVDPQDKVISALSPAPTQKMLDGLDIPLAYSAIINLHFKLDQDIKVDWPAPLIGLIGGAAQWVFIRGSIASVTISAGNDLLDKLAVDLANEVWNEISPLFDKTAKPLPPYKVIKEKRATLAQSPELEPYRPSPDTAYKNLFLAGDWTDTGLPATIEGAIRSGYLAAKIAYNDDSKSLGQ